MVLCRPMLARRYRLPLLALAWALLVCAPAQGRDVLVAAGAPGLVFVDQTTSAVRGQLAFGGPAVAVASAPDGASAFVAEGPRVTAVTLATRAPAWSLPLAGQPYALAVTTDGTRVLAGRPGAVDIINAIGPTPVIAATLTLGSKAAPRAIAVSSDGLWALALLDERRIAVIDLALSRVFAHIRLRGARGIAAARGGAFWVTSPRASGGLLLRIDPASAQVTARIGIGKGVGGSLSLSPSGGRALIGASGTTAVAAIVDLSGSAGIMRVRVGGGPATTATSPDGTRFYTADSSGGTLSVLSVLSRKRLKSTPIPGTPLGVAVQPGIALLRGSEGPDTLVGTRGADLIEGLGGNDMLSGYRAADQLFGGPGDDTLDGGTDDDVLDGGDGNDRLSGKAGNDKLSGGNDNDALNGGTGNDTLDGGDGPDYLDGGDGDDTIHGGLGDDKINEAQLGNDKLLDGGPGDDTIDGGRGSDLLIDGGDGNDVLFGGPGSEHIEGGTGNDTIDGGTGGDLLFGREGDDAIRGDSGRDTIYGSYGSDTLDGGSGDDSISGSYGSDTIVGGSGADVIDGGTGNDEIRAADGDQDTVNCGPGRDTVYTEEDAPTRDRLFSCEKVILVPAEPSSDAPPAAGVITGTDGDDILTGTDANDSLFGQGGDDELFGQGGDDYVDGVDGNDTLHGGAGNDDMHGRNGNDVILGNEGDDRIFGERGNDTIDGGPGNDTIQGNLDDDTIQGGEGDDRIQVVGGGFDRVACGPGNDTVYADATDEVAADCEVVKR